MKRVLVLLSVSATIGLAVLSGGAAAAAGPTPNGYVGACNMLMAGPGMANAMSADNPRGNAGMFRAVSVSGCV